jgi:hypothetical protein
MYVPHFTGRSPAEKILTRAAPTGLKDLTGDVRSSLHQASASLSLVPFSFARSNPDD